MSWRVHRPTSQVHKSSIVCERPSLTKHLVRIDAPAPKKPKSSSSSSSAKVTPKPLTLNNVVDKLHQLATQSAALLRYLHDPTYAVFSVDFGTKSRSFVCSFVAFGFVCTVLCQSLSSRFCAGQCTKLFPWRWMAKATWYESHFISLVFFLWSMWWLFHCFGVVLFDERWRLPISSRRLRRRE